MKAQWTAQKVSEMMHHPRCIGVTRTAADVLLQMDANEINHLPVTETGNANERLLGIVTRRDLEKHLSGEIQDSNYPVRNMMTSLSADYAERTNREDGHVLTPDDSISKGIEYLASRVQVPGHARQVYVSALMVVDTESNIVGVLGYKDILKGFLKNKENYSWMEDKLVSEFMLEAEKLFCVEPNEEFKNVYTALRTHPYRTIPVVERTDDCLRLRGLIEDLSAYELLRSELLKDEIKASHPALMYNDQQIHLIYPEQTIQEILPLFLERPFHDALLVVDNENDKRSRCLVGLLSYVDVFRHFYEELEKS